MKMKKIKKKVETCKVKIGYAAHIVATDVLMPVANMLTP
jgi:hypothetical protein